MNRATIDKIIQEARAICAPISLDAQKKSDVRKLDVGCVITYKGELFRITEKNRYKESKWEWFELKLFSLKDGSTQFLEWEFDDYLDITLYNYFPKFRTLKLDRSKLDYLDDEEEGSFRYEGTQWHYEDSGKAQFFRNMNGTPESHYYWTFVDQSDTKVLSIEDFEGEYDVSVGISIAESAIRTVATK